MAKVWSNVILVLSNVTMELSNVRKKNKRIAECDKSTVIYDVGIVQCDNGTVKCEKKIQGPSNVRNVRSNMMLVLLNMTMKPSNVRKKIRESSNVTKV